MRRILIVPAIFMLSFMTASCLGSKKKRLANNIESLQIANLPAKDITVLSVEEHGKGEALWKVDIHTAFLMKRNSRGEWEIQSIRLGDRRWEEVRHFVEALNQARIQQVKKDFEKLATAIDKYQAKTKSYPLAQSIADLTDLLHPNYLPEVLRVDPWGTEYNIHLDAQGKFELITAGPDRKFGTNDDVRFTR